MGKRKYRVCNWADYNKALVQRGNLTYWISQKVLDDWHFSGQRSKGGEKKYSDSAIQATLALKELFNLSYRMCEGFLKSFFSQLHLDNLSAPDYSTICRRAKEIKISFKRRIKSNEPIHVLIDSTGFSLHGEGEWKRKKHGQDKQKAWVKCHLAVDYKTLQILSLETSGSREQDGSYLSPLIDGIKSPVSAIYADGAYDKLKCYKKARERDAVLITPPQRNAALQENMKPCERNIAYSSRDTAIRYIQSYDSLEEGRKQWKINSGYHQRSLVENTIFRLKTFFGDSLRCRSIVRQIKQLEIRCYILNKITELGMPLSVCIE